MSDLVASSSITIAERRDTGSVLAQYEFLRALILDDTEPLTGTPTARVKMQSS